MGASFKPHLIVVDDEPQVLTAVEDHLEDDFVVHALADGKAALALLSELKNVAVLVSDQRMPGMTGDELFARATEISDAAQVMITGYADLEAVIRAVNKGRIFGYITKPWDQPSLKMMVHKAAEHYSLLRDLEYERSLLHNLMQHMPDEIYFKGLDHRYIRINHAAARGQNISAPEAAIGRMDVDFGADPAQADAMHAEDRQVAETGKPMTVDELRRTPGGSTYWVSKTKAPVFDEKGTVTSIVAIARDITERKRIEEALRESEKEVRLLHAATDAMSAAPDVSAALREAMRILCEAAGWHYGEVWLMRDDRFVVGAEWHVDDPGIDAFARAAREVALAPGEGLPGKVWRNVKPAWIPDLAAAAEKDAFMRTEGVRVAGLRAVLAVPVTGDDGLPRAVMLLFRRTAEAGIERVTRLATAVARQLGGAIERKQNAAQLAQREVLLRSVLDTLPVGVHVADRDGQIVMKNPAGERIWSGNGHAGADAAQTRGWWLADGAPVGADDGLLARAVQKGEVALGKELEIERPDGSRRIVSGSGAPIRDQHGAVTGGLMVIEDITERRAQERRIERLTRMHATLSGINTMIVRAKSREELFSEACRVVVEVGRFHFIHIWLADVGHRTLRLAASGGAERLKFEDIDLRDADAPGTPTAVKAFAANRVVVVNDLGSEDAPSPLRQAMIESGCRAVVSLPMQRDGSCVGVLSFGSADAAFFDDEEVRLLEELAGDIEYAMETLAKGAELSYLALYDPLTGLSNRARFVGLVEAEAASAREEGKQLAVVAVNLTRFRNVNDSLGRHVGDDLLKQVGARLATAAGREHVARLGADLYCVLLPAVDGAKEATRGAGRLRDALAADFVLAERQMHVDVRLGVALFPGDGEGAEALCANAEAALKVSRGADDTVVFYKADLNARVSAQLDLENRLRQALKEQQFVLHYQPKVIALSGAIAGAEALIRWQDPREGMISPGRFVPVLEETGLIVEAGKWALEEAARMRARLRSRNLACPRIAVNVSQIQMRRADFTAEAIAAMSAGVAGDHGIDLEITESLLADNINEAVRKLKLLREAGFNIAVDDFGTGYSSLGYLARLPIDTLKIDRSFIITMTEDADAMALVSTIINLAHSFRLNVVAEGVETEEQLKMLRLLRCDTIQGYLFHKPMPEDRFAELLAAPAATG